MEKPGSCLRAAAIDSIDVHENRIFAGLIIFSVFAFFVEIEIGQFFCASEKIFT